MLQERERTITKGLTMDQLSAGQEYESKAVVTPEMIEDFARATGDYNPIHLNEDYARRTIFKARVAHGMLQAGLISGVLGTQFPGVGTIYLSQTLRFLKPVFIGDELTIRLKVLELIKEKHRAHLETMCINQKGETVVSGEAVVMPPA